MNYQVIRQTKLEDTARGPRFEILVKAADGMVWKSTYLFLGREGITEFIEHEDSNLELGAKMTPEEIWIETFEFLRREGYSS